MYPASFCARQIMQPWVVLKVLLLIDEKLLQIWGEVQLSTKDLDDLQKSHKCFSTSRRSAHIWVGGPGVLHEGASELKLDPVCQSCQGQESAANGLHWQEGANQPPCHKYMMRASVCFTEPRLESGCIAHQHKLLSQKGTIKLILLIGLFLNSQ